MYCAKLLRQFQINEMRVNKEGGLTDKGGHGFAGLGIRFFRGPFLLGH